jgi:putative (di)nucleoside polyphosphate hydrolase
VSAADDTLYRPNVGIMLLNAHGRVFVAKRIDFPGEAWQMPQGGIDDGEEPRSAALRELEEEIGTAKAELLAESRDWFRYELPTELQGKLWGGKWKGQRQKWFAMRFTGVDGDINIATSHPEFSAWRWADPGDVPRLIIPFKRAIYERVVEEFRPYWERRK